jgi:hypothetical protein
MNHMEVEDEADDEEIDLSPAYGELRQLRGWDLCRNICAAVNGVDGIVRPPYRELTEDEATNPFVRIFQYKSCVCCSCSPYLDLATIFLKQVDAFETRRNTPPADRSPHVTTIDGSLVPQPHEFISLQQFISMNTDWPGMHPRQAQLPPLLAGQIPPLSSGGTGG